MSKLMVENCAPDPCAARAGSFLQKRGYPHAAGGGLSPEELAQLFPRSLPISRSPILRSFQRMLRRPRGFLRFGEMRPRTRERGAPNSRGGVATSSGGWTLNVGLLPPKFIFRPPGKQSSSWERSLSFRQDPPFRQDPLEDMVYLKKSDPSPLRKLLEGAPERCKARTFSRISPYYPRLQ